MNLRIWCPSCGQGWVHRKRAPDSDPFWVCDECEAVWLGTDIAPTPDDLLEAHLEVIGSQARYWNDLIDSSEVLVEPPDGGA